MKSIIEVSKKVVVTGLFVTALFSQGYAKKPAPPVAAQEQAKGPSVQDFIENFTFIGAPIEQQLNNLNTNLQENTNITEDVLQSHLEVFNTQITLAKKQAENVATTLETLSDINAIKSLESLHTILNSLTIAFSKYWNSIETLKGKLESWPFGLSRLFGKKKLMKTTLANYTTDAKIKSEKLQYFASLASTVSDRMEQLRKHPTAKQLVKK